MESEYQSVILGDIFQNNLDGGAAGDENIKPQVSPEKYAAPPKVCPYPAQPQM